MIVIDNFLNLTTLSLLRMAIENELMMKDTAITKKNLAFEKEFLGLENSKFYILTGSSKHGIATAFNDVFFNIYLGMEHCGQCWWCEERQ